MGRRNVVNEFHYSQRRISKFSLLNDGVGFRLAAKLPNIVQYMILPSSNGEIVLEAYRNTINIEQSPYLG
ncbi:hypothetical protein [Paenibacillus sp. LPE1-1-1.1]|uniref:hypothetical protein n=1 Tax=Paenibacillus sp. LPE1-1-1.1 TaxID=3135230 RepID=UPI003437A2DE